VKETPEHRERFGVAGLPTVVLAKPGGEEIDRTLGFLDTDEFTSTIDDYRKGIGTLSSMLAKEADKKGDAAFLFELGEKLYAHARYGDADERFAAVISADGSNEHGFSDDAQLERARSKGKIEDYAQAIELCTALIERWPNSDLKPDATIYAGYYSDRAGRTDDAMRIYGQYLEQWPDGEDADWAQGQIEKLETPDAED